MFCQRKREFVNPVVIFASCSYIAYKICRQDTPTTTTYAAAGIHELFPDLESWLWSRAKNSRHLRVIFSGRSHSSARSRCHKTVIFSYVFCATFYKSAHHLQKLWWQVLILLPIRLRGQLTHTQFFFSASTSEIESGEEIWSSRIIAHDWRRWIMMAWSRGVVYVTLETHFMRSARHLAQNWPLPTTESPSCVVVINSVTIIDANSFQQELGVVLQAMKLVGTL